MNSTLFLSDIFPESVPVVVKLIDLESGESFVRNLGAFVDSPNLLSNLSKRDQSCISALINQQL